MTVVYWSQPNQQVVRNGDPVGIISDAPDPQDGDDDVDPRTHPGNSTIAVVRQWVDDHPDSADEVLAAEERRGADARVSLLEWLEGFIANRDDPP